MASNITKKGKSKSNEEKRNIPPAITKILEYDVKITKAFVTFALNLVPVRPIQLYGKGLEISCHGIAWLSSWLAFCYMFDNRNLYQMQVNMLFGLILDIIFVAVIKAATRRRRPSANEDIFSIGPDKFSFPSGHTSRSFYVGTFFTILYPLPWLIVWPIFGWAFMVGFSRILLYRHHILDVLAGALLGVLEGCLLYFLWLGPDISNYIMRSISEDYVPGGPEEL